METGAAMTLKAPFPWFGGKARAAKLIWSRLGRIDNYVEPFFGSGAVLLNRSLPVHGPETVNDKDGFVTNAWRALASDPDAVADWADRPVFENDLHAIHTYLVGQLATFVPRLEADPDFFDAKIAGWWLWGIACWIGSGWCSGKGPWQSVEMEDGSRQLVHLGNAGQGVNRQLVHLGDAGQGVNRKLVHLGDAGRGDHGEALIAYFRAIADRFRHVRVCCGDWTRIMGDTPLFPTGRGSPNYRVGVVLDPPYADEADRADDLYREDSLTVARDVREWALAHGDDPRLHIALCGYFGEHDMPLGWECVEGKSGGGHGYGGQTKGGDGYANAGRERIWFSPHCQRPERMQSLFPDDDEASLFAAAQAAQPLFAEATA